MQKQHDASLTIVARDPSLLVYWTGGNELGYPSLKSKTGKSYKKYYRKVVQNLKAGAPEASCLLIGPLDQAMRENGQIVSKPTLDKIIRFQREVAEEEGCAYWDARAAMVVQMSRLVGCQTCFGISRSCPILLDVSALATLSRRNDAGA